MRQNKKRRPESDSRLGPVVIQLVLWVLCSLGFARCALASVGFVQVNAADPQAFNVTSVPVTFTSAQGAGDLNVVIVSWEDASGSVQSVADSQGNTYSLAVGPTVAYGSYTQSIYYAKNIAAASANANTVNVTFSGGGDSYPDVRIAEYSGIDTTSPLDITAVDMGYSAMADSGNATTVHTNDLLVAGNIGGAETTGAGSSFTQRILSDQDFNILEDRVVTAAGPYNATAPESDSDAWIMQMVAFKAATTGTDTSPPATPTGFATLATSSSQIILSWTATTDNVGVTGYLLERCAGAACTSFTQVASLSPYLTSYRDTGLTASTTYTYRLRATDAAANLSGYSSVASSQTYPSGSIGFVQVNAADPQVDNVASVAATYTGAQTGGNLNVVVVSWWAAAGSVQSITDTAGNAYTLAVGPTVAFSSYTIATYYAKNITSAGANTNTVTVTFSSGGVAYPDIRIAEYSGLDTSSPLDVTAAASDFSATADSGPATTTHAYDLLIGANIVGSETAGPGPGFTQRIITDQDFHILEDETVTAIGTYDATALESQADGWIMQLAAFKSASSSSPDTTPPSVPAGVSATTTSSTQISLSWTVSTDNTGVTGYLVERCQGASCTAFAQISTPTTTSYSDTGLTASTSYSYRVRATDAAGNLSGYSSTASATTSATGGGGGGDTTPPSAPTGLSATVISGNEVDLTWSASTDNVGVTGYLVERCPGAGCTTFAQVGTPTTTSLDDTGLTPSTTYTYRVRATDAAGNLSGYSSTTSVTTSTTGSICD